MGKLILYSLLVLTVGSIIVGLLIKVIFSCSNTDAIKISLLVFVFAGMYGFGSALNES